MQRRALARLGCSLLQALSETPAPAPCLSSTARAFAQTAPEPDFAHKRKLAEASEHSDFGSIRIAEVIKEKQESGLQSAGMFWCRPQDKVFEAISKMAEANVGSILVMKSDKPLKSEVEGLITERDYLRKVAVTGKSSKDMACSALMTPTANIVDITPHDTVAKAMRVMETRKIRHLPVYDGDKLLGMLSIKDIISTFIGQHETDVSSMSSYIAGNTY